MIKDWKSLHVNIIKSNSIHCLKKNTRLCPNAWVDCPLIFTYCYFHLFINLLISFFGHSLWNVLIQDLASYECRCTWNCYQKSNSHKESQHSWNKTTTRKKSLPWHNNKLLKTGNLIQNKPLLSCQIFKRTTYHFLQERD